MKITLETRALAWALLASALSLGSALLVASPIRGITNSPASHPAGNQPIATVASNELQTVANTGLLARGAQDFALTCADCHGDDARGDEGPDLHHLGISNARIAATIHNGVKGEMPSFAKKYNQQDVNALIAYLRSLP